MTFIDHFTCTAKICRKYLQMNQYLSSFCFSRYQYVPETLIHKNNMGIIGNDVRINKNNEKIFWEVLEEIISKILSILGSDLALTLGCPAYISGKPLLSVL